MRNGLFIDSDGTQRWYLDNELHREDDLPAVIWRDTSQIWYRHGQLHRENGPAIIYNSQSWWINDKRIYVEEWIKDNNITTSWESWDDVTWSLFRLEFL